MVLEVKNLSANVANIRDVGSIPGLGRSSGGRHGNPLQYSCLENTKDRVIWWTTVHRVAEIQTWLKQCIFILPSFALWILAAWASVDNQLCLLNSGTLWDSAGFPPLSLYCNPERLPRQQFRTIIGSPLTNHSHVLPDAQCLKDQTFNFLNLFGLLF